MYITCMLDTVVDIEDYTNYFSFGSVAIASALSWWDNQAGQNKRSCIIINSSPPKYRDMHTPLHPQKHITFGATAIAIIIVWLLRMNLTWKSR